MEAGVDQEGRVTQEEPREDALRKTVGDVSTESPNRDRNQRPAPKARSPLTTSARRNPGIGNAPSNGGSAAPASAPATGPVPLALRNASPQHQ